MICIGTGDRFASSAASQSSSSGWVGGLPIRPKSLGVSTSPRPKCESQARFTIRAAPYSFDRPSAGDRILTVSGDQIAYIAGARWVTAANMLFEDAVNSAFEAHGGPARLLARDEPVAADYVLKLDVRTFEVRYDHGRGSPPTVVVELYAALVGRQNAAEGVTQLFRVEAPASEDAVHSIAAAFDVAVAKVLGEMIAWVENNAKA